MKDLTELAAEERRAYRRKWNAENRDKNREYRERYWMRRAEEKLKAEGGATAAS